MNVSKKRIHQAPTSVITIDNISKFYTLHHERPTLVERLIKQKVESYPALKNIFLSILAGEKVGIIGPNGSGKTTLLKIISGISTPTSGHVKTQGKIVSLIDLEAGFHGDLTGYQNIFTNGLLIGMQKKEIKEKIDSIISYADIGRFIDIPMYTYSLGMKLRLGFAIAIHSNPDILILDEGMSVGDIVFKEKIKKSLQALFQTNRTVIVTSHGMNIINEYCKRVIVLYKGSIMYDGGNISVTLYQKMLEKFAHSRATTHRRSTQ